MTQKYFGTDGIRGTVGQPPITRWDYREFSVYFEYDHVVKSVIHHQPRHPISKEQQ